MKIPKELKKKKKHPRKNIPKFLEKKKAIAEKKGVTGNFGPIVYQQMGNIVWMKNVLNPQQHNQFKKEWIAQRPEIKKDIVNSFAELKKLINAYAALDFLDFIAMDSALFNPETFEPSTEGLLEIHNEYAFSFITANCSKICEEHPSFENCQEFLTIIKKIIDLCIQYYMREDLQDESEKSVRFQSIISFLDLRGDSYEDHRIDLIKEIFTPFDNFFQKQFGFNTQQLLEMTEEIKIQRLNNFFKKGELIENWKEINKKITALLEEKGIDLESQIDSEIIQEIYNNKEISELRAKATEISYSTTEYYNEINITEKVRKDLIDIFCIELGNNDEFLGFTPNWPLNNSLIYRKPFLKVGDKYYAFGNTIFFRNLIRILESLIFNYAEGYFNNKYMVKKAKLLEDMTIKYFETLLPDSDVYQNLFYNISESGVLKRVEVDAIIIYDKHLFIIEAKANQIPLSARRGSIKKIKKSLKKILDKAYEQAIRCKKYIDENRIARFEYEDKMLALEIKKEEFDHFYLINTTIERLRHFSIQLDDVREFNLLKGDEDIWTVFINDLRIISEINDCPSVFLLYLQRRKKALQNIDFFNQDEIELYGHFLKTGLYYPEKISDTKLQLIGQMHDIDEYYMSKNNNKKKVPKPGFNVSDIYLDLVRKIENINKNGFSIASMFLLQIETHDQEVILNFILKYGKFSLKTGKDYKCLLCYKDLNCIVELVVRSNSSNDEWKAFNELLELGMYKYKYELGILYKIVIDKNRNIQIDFEITKEKWKFNSEKETRVKKNAFKGMKKIKG